MKPLIALVLMFLGGVAQAGTATATIAWDHMYVEQEEIYGFNIEQQTGDDAADWVMVGSVEREPTNTSTSYSYTQTGVDDNTSHRWRVRAFNAYGNSLWAYTVWYPLSPPPSGSPPSAPIISISVVIEYPSN